MEHFIGLPLPYSREVKDLPRKSLPNLQISNVNQSLYSVLKYLRGDVLGKKLKNSGYLLFDKFVWDVLGVGEVKVHSLYPPENEEKLEQLLSALKESDVDSVGLDCVIYYLLKDFSFDAAEEFVCGSKDIQHLDHSTVSLRIPRSLYDLMNAIYFIDRFDIYKSLKYLNPNDHSTLPMSFISYYIKFANICPYHPAIDVSSVSDVGDMKAFIDSQSCKPSACSVVASVRAFNVPILSMDADTQLLFWDSLSDLNPHSTVCAMEEMGANYDTQLLIGYPMIVKLGVMKLLVKTLKQQKAIQLLESANKLNGASFDEIFRHLAMFVLVDTKMDDLINDVLSELMYGVVSEEEKTMRAKFPHYFSRLDEHKMQIRKTSRDLLAWKAALENKPHRLAEIALVNVGPEHSGVTLKEVAQRFY